MESIFNLEETERSSLLQHIIQSFGFTYVCLWSHHSNCLIFVDGAYKEENSEAGGSSYGSLGMRSFLDYQKSVFLIDNYNGRVPGFAFMHNLTYMKHSGLELLQLASSPAQLQFYQEARIKTAIFMGCKNGEIELGMANSSSQVNYEFKLKKLLPGDFPQEVLIPQPLDQAQASSSPSSLRSLSMENNVNYPLFLSNMLQTSTSSTMRSEDPLQQALIKIRSNHILPSREHEEAAITRAILAAILSSSSSPHRLRAPSAFKQYQTYLGPVKRVQNPQNVNRRSLSFFRNLSEARTQQEDQTVHATRLTSNQLHHMISERKRREKLNASFQALRSLLPPGSKKDKTSVLSNIKEYIDSLKSQVEELTKRNKILEVEHSKKETLNQDSGGFSSKRPFVRITDSNESTSESQVVDLEVNVSGNSILKDLAVRVLKFVNQVDNVTVTSIDARIQTLDTEAIANRVVLRLRIEGSEWDRSSFQEALTRALNDLAQ